MTHRHTDTRRATDARTRLSTYINGHKHMHTQMHTQVRPYAHMIRHTPTSSMPATPAHGQTHTHTWSGTHTHLKYASHTSAEVDSLGPATRRSKSVCRCTPPPPPPHARSASEASARCSSSGLGRASHASRRYWRSRTCAHARCSTCMQERGGGGRGDTGCRFTPPHHHPAISTPYPAPCTLYPTP